MITTQTEISFPNRSKFNPERCSGQTKRLYDHLKAGYTVHCFDPRIRELRIGYLNSRIADITGAGFEVYKRRIKVKDISGNLVDVVEYSMKPFN